MADKEPIRWITVHGAHVPIYENGYAEDYKPDDESNHEWMNKTFISKHEALNTIESDIRNQSYETGVCISQRGKVIFSQDGDMHGVEFTDEQYKKLEGNILTHNHPSSSCFSEHDLYIFANYGLLEMRAIGANGKGCSISLTNITPQKHPSTIGDDYRKAVSGYEKTEIKEYYANSEYDEVTTIKNINKMIDKYRRSWLKANAATYGFQYKEFKGV